jgi:hypothetical protein
LHDSFWVSVGSKSVEICRRLVFGWPLIHRCWLHCLVEDCKLRLTRLSFLSTVAHQLSAYGVAFWMLMGQSLLIRDWESVSSGISLGRVDVYVVVWKL